jgi:hypothetical protein
VREIGGAGNASAGGTTAGLTALGSVGSLAVGVGGDLSPSVDGIATHSVGALAGARLPVTPEFRVLVLGEAGVRTFWDPKDFLAETRLTPGELTLPYMGVRAGLTWLVSRPFDLGAMAFFKKELRTGRITSEQEPFLDLPHTEPVSTTRVHEVGGFAVGLSLQIGFRFDTRRS